MKDTLARTQDNEQETLPPLTLKQQAWITHLFTDANLNPSQAVRLAGYDCSTNDSVWRIASDNVRKLQVHVQAMMKANGMQPEEVLSRLSDLARTTMDDVVDVDDNGHFKINLKRARDRGRLHTVKKLKDSPKFGIEIEMADAQEALHDLAAIHKLFPEKNPVSLTQVNVNAQTAPLTPEERLDRLCKLVAQEGIDAVCAHLGGRFVPYDTVIQDAVDVQDVFPDV